ncbi:hypothetical protein [Virgibacillus sp. CBA3643]
MHRTTLYQKLKKFKLQ